MTPLIFIVDDDAGMRDSLAMLLELRGHMTKGYASAETLLSDWSPDWRGCVIADLKLPGLDGIALQAELRKRGCAMPVVIITAHGDVASARTAFLAEAVDFIQKPFESGVLLNSVDRALQRERSRGDAERQHQEQRRALERLTPRERDVLERVSRGLHGKEIAAELDICLRTVETHKANLMAKLGARNVAELVRFAVKSEA